MNGSLSTKIQKIPKLLDIVHLEIEQRQVKFALTGSSARKLKRGSANLLAGRAFVFNLFPLTHVELDSKFDLDFVIQWGSLPKIFDFETTRERKLYLENYVDVFLKEEVFAEQLARRVQPFRKFMSLAAQSSGTVLNFSKIGRDVSVDSKTVKTYFDILEDTLLGFYLYPTERSFRKKQIKSPKFYLFDAGVKRAIEGIAHLDIRSSQELGPLFEHFIINEIYRLNSYLEIGYELSYLLTEGGTEIDLVLSKPNQESILIEIKSTTNVQEQHVKELSSLRKDFPEQRYICISREDTPRLLNGIEVLPWKTALVELGFSS